MMSNFWLRDLAHTRQLNRNLLASADHSETPGVVFFFTPV